MCLTVCSVLLILSGVFALDTVPVDVAKQVSHTMHKGFGESSLCRDLYKLHYFYKK